MGTHTHVHTHAFTYIYTYTYTHTFTNTHFKHARPKLRPAFHHNLSIEPPSRRNGRARDLAADDASTGPRSERALSHTGTTTRA